MVQTLSLQVFSYLPSSVFAQNNGVIQLTGVWREPLCRHLDCCIIGDFGFTPAVAGVIQAVPQAVLGGAVMVMFGAVAASGINILSGIHLDRRALLIIAISLALGGQAQVPQFWNTYLNYCNIFSSGVATGGIAALLLKYYSS